MSIEAAGKPLQMLHEAAPNADPIAVLWNPANAVYQSGMLEATKAAGKSLGVELRVLPATNVEEIEEAFKAMDRAHVQELDILADPLFAIDHNQARIISLATSARFPERSIESMRHLWKCAAG